MGIKTPCKIEIYFYFLFSILLISIKSVWIAVLLKYFISLLSFTYFCLFNLMLLFTIQFTAGIQEATIPSLYPQIFMSLYFKCIYPTKHIVQSCFCIQSVFSSFKLFYSLFTLNIITCASGCESAMLVFIYHLSLLFFVRFHFLDLWG